MTPSRTLNFPINLRGYVLAQTRRADSLEGIGPPLFA